MKFRHVCALLLCAASALAFAPSDICRVQITVLYSSGPNNGNSLVFSIAGEETNGGLDLQPGDFTIAIEGRLCSDDAIVGYQGTSSTVTLDGTNTGPQTVTIVALDTEVFGSALDQSVDQPPIIVSISVSPQRIKVGEASTVQITAIDPQTGVEPTAYSLAMSGSGTFIPSDKSCAGGESCSIQYTAGSTDSGNLPFVFQVSDAAGNTDSINGNLNVDASNEIQLDLQAYNVPTINSVSSSTQRVEFGTTQSITVVTTDLDISTLGDVVTISDISISDVDSALVGTQQALDCTTTSAVVSATAVVGDVTTFTVTWSPWDGVAGTQEDFGETFCKLAFTASDSQSLLSQVVEFEMGAIGTDTNNAGGADIAALPYFVSLFTETFSPTQGDTVTLTLEYRDEDSLLSLDIDDGGLSTANNFATISDENCQTSACSRTVDIVADGSIGAHTMTITLTDAVTGLTDTRSLTFNTQSARKRRSVVARRSSSGGDGTYRTEITIEDGHLAVAVDRQQGEANTELVVSTIPQTPDESNLVAKSTTTEVPYTNVHPDRPEFESQDIHVEGGWSQNEKAGLATGIILLIALLGVAVGMMVGRSRTAVPAAPRPSMLSNGSANSASSANRLAENSYEGDFDEVSSV